MSIEALVIFAKAPVPGEVKTRLIPPLTPEESCTLYQAFVEDLLECFSPLPGVQLFLAGFPSHEHPFFNALSEKYPVSPLNQSGKDLGSRMAHMFHGLFQKGFKRICIIGSDSPTLPASLVPEAMQKLKDHDLVLGPSQDGGYYLIGLSKEIPGVFEGISWGTDRVLAQTLEKIQEENPRLFMLPFWYDVDHFDDLTFLNRHLAVLGKKGRRIPERTRSFLNARPGLLERVWEKR